MKILFSEISSTCTSYRLNNVVVPLGYEGYQLQGPVSFNCTLSKKRGGIVMLLGEVTASLLLGCDRCLDMIPFQVQSKVSLSFVVEDDDRLCMKDIELPIDDLDIIELLDPVIDLEEIAVQQLDYNLPVKYLCDTDCRGICFGCGVNSNREDCRCLEDICNNPFAVLSELKNK